MSARWVKTRRASPRRCIRRDARVYGHTITAIHDMTTPPSPFVQPLLWMSQFLYCNSAFEPSQDQSLSDLYKVSAQCAEWGLCYHRGPLNVLRRCQGMRFDIVLYRYCGRAVVIDAHDGSRNHVFCSHFVTVFYPRNQNIRRHVCSAAAQRPGHARSSILRANERNARARVVPYMGGAPYKGGALQGWCLTRVVPYRGGASQSISHPKHYFE